MCVLCAKFLIIHAGTTVQLAISVVNTYQSMRDIWRRIAITCLLRRVMTLVYMYM